MHDDDIRTEAATVYLGRTTERLHVFADIRMTTPSPTRVVEFTDHHRGPAPVEFAVSFEVLAPRAPVKGGTVHPDDIADGWWVSAGQAGDDARAARPAPGSVTRAEARAILAAWDALHLNDMQAACDHMTEAMLTPPHGIAERYGRPDVQGWRLDHVVCPETGYRYGHAWLARAVPADTLDAMRAIMAAHGVTR